MTPRMVRRQPSIGERMAYSPLISPNKTAANYTARMRSNKSFSAGSRPPTGESSPRVGEVVQRGEAEIGIQPISELIEVAGSMLSARYQADLQSPDLVYVAGSPATSEQPLPAKALIDFLAAPSAHRSTSKWDGAGYAARLPAGEANNQAWALYDWHRQVGREQAGRSRVGRVNGRDEDASRPDLRRPSLPR